MSKKGEKPKVSIIIPTYNSGKTLSECLKSIYSQSYPFFEVIIVDNYSDDNTLEIAKQFGAKIMQAKSNPATARNIGIRNSTGKYLLFLDSDQLLSPFALEECVEKCEKEKACMVTIPEKFIGKSFWGLCSAVWKNCYEKIGQIYSECGDENTIRGEPRFFTKKELTQVGLFNSALFWGEDYDLHEKLRRMNIKEVICKSKIYHNEPDSLKKILSKNFLYGKSLPIFFKSTRKSMLAALAKQAFFTFKYVLTTFRKRPAIVAGCAFLLFLKSCFLITGLFTGYITENL
jgi:glycosyltransferase involved in cell wall biosynthesis